MDTTSRIYVAGHRGMVGGAIMRVLESRGHSNIVTRSRAELDLTDAGSVEAFFATGGIEYVFLAAALVGGIEANQRRCGEFIYENLLIQTHVIDAARRHGVRRLLFLGSSCIYPRLAEQPIREDALLSGPLEPTNSAYAVAKIAGAQMCSAYWSQYGFDAFTVMPSNVYGPGDCFDPGRSHVVAALMRRFHEAKLAGVGEVLAWGSGRPMREFIYADDIGSACVFLMDQGVGEFRVINAGSGREVSIADLVEMIVEVVGYRGRVVWDDSKPDGTPRKLMDSGRLRRLGWRSRVCLRDGLEAMYAWYCAQERGRTWQDEFGSCQGGGVV